MKRPGRNRQLLHGRPHQLLPCLVQPAELVDISRARTCAGAVPWCRGCRPGWRSRWRWRAASTRARIAAEGSSLRSSASLSYSTRGTSMWMSMRFSSGPSVGAAELTYKRGWVE
ncbi:MAG: hypothetical protein JXA42_14440 [Anaerolineales bacterium]|nr:hypothetical protein [Anaerolineales bacterium]